MKRLLSILIVVLMLVACAIGNAVADNFTIHSGVQFGMTINEVFETESAAGFIPQKRAGNAAYDFTNCKERHSINSLLVRGQIAGQKDAMIIYHFDQAEQLNAAIYEFSDDPNVYGILRESLINKYGEPDTTLSDAWHALLKPDAYCGVDYYGRGLAITYYNNDSWLLPQENGTYILISGISIRMSNGSYYAYDSIVGYQSFNNNEIDSALSTLSTELITYTEQLNTDL